MAITFLSARWLTFHTYYPWWAGDSGGYSAPFYRAWTGDVAMIDGVRTPTYPLFLGVVQLLSGMPPRVELALASAERATELQAALSLLALGCVYYLARRLYGLSAFAGMVSAAIVGGSLCLAMYDRIILTEALATSLLIYSVTALVALDSAWRSHWSRRLALMLATGVSLGAAALTRPNLIVFVAIFLLGVVLARLWRSFAGRGRPKWARLRTFALPSGLAGCMVGAWIAFNYVNTGYAKLSNFEGFSLATRCYNCTGAVADSHPVFAQIMNDLNDKYDRLGIVKEDLVHEGLPQIYAAAGAGKLEFRLTGCCGRATAELNAYLAEVMKLAIARRPDLYTANVLRSLKMLPTMTTPLVLDTEARSDPRMPELGGSVNRCPASSAVLLEFVKCGDRLASVILWIFYLLPLALVLRPMRKRFDLRLAGMWLGIVAMNLAACLVTAWFDRYAVVSYPFCVLFCVWAVSTLWVSRSRLRTARVPR